jgi:hypothetical protein
MHSPTVRLVTSVTECNFNKMATKQELEVIFQRYNLEERFQRRLWGFLERLFHFWCILLRIMLGNTGNANITCQTGSGNNFALVQHRRTVPTVNMGFFGSEIPCLVYSTALMLGNTGNSWLDIPISELTYHASSWEIHHRHLHRRNASSKLTKLLSNKSIEPINDLATFVYKLRYVHCQFESVLFF